MYRYQGYFHSVRGGGLLEQRHEGLNTANGVWHIILQLYSDYEEMKLVMMPASNYSSRDTPEGATRTGLEKQFPDFRTSKVQVGAWVLARARPELFQTRSHILNAPLLIDPLCTCNKVRVPTKQSCLPYFGVLGGFLA